MKVRKARWDEIEMTGLLGYVRTDYKTLVKKLGKPHITCGDKVTCEWQIVIDGEVATIYDWKESKTPKDMYNWHIGGNNKRVVTMVQNFLYS